MEKRLNAMYFRRSCALGLALVATATLSRPIVARAPSAPTPDAPPVSTAPDTSEEDSKPVDTLKVNVNLVSLYFTVRDKKNGLIPTLGKDDCSVYEDKVLQKLKNFTAEADQPLTLGLLLDTSGSQQNVLPMEQET